MKLIALAAALAVGGTAVAQDAPQQSTTTTQDTTSPSTPAGTQDTTAPATSQNSTTATDQSTTGTTGAGTTGDTGTAVTADEPRGGYMPSTPAMSGTPAPGDTVVVMPSRSPSEAFPAPAPLKHYPICKRGQFDNCRQRGG